MAKRNNDGSLFQYDFLSGSIWTQETETDRVGGSWELVVEGKQVCEETQRKQKQKSQDNKNHLKETPK